MSICTRAKYSERRTNLTTKEGETNGGTKWEKERRKKSEGEGSRAEEGGEIHL